MVCGLEEKTAKAQHLKCVLHWSWENLRKYIESRYSINLFLIIKLQFGSCLECGHKMCEQCGGHEETE